MNRHSKQVILLFFYIFGTISHAQELIFNSGFEPSVSISTATATTSEIIGTDNSLTIKNNWKNHLDAHPNIGYSVLQFDDGATNNRGATIIPDPTNVNNNVIQFWSKEPNIANTYGRVQACIYANNNLKNILNSVRMYLPSDINLIQQMNSTFDWFTILEFWNSPNWTSDSYPFRVSLNIRKLASGDSPLRMRAYGQKYDINTSKWDYIWDDTNTNISIPIGKWFTLETHIIEGNAENGKLRVTMTPDGEASVILFDLTNYTHHPDEPIQNGIDYINPFKLYTAANLVTYTKNNNGLLNVLYDDYKLWKDVPITTLAIDKVDAEKGFLFWDSNLQKVKYQSTHLTEKSKISCHIFDSFGKLILNLKSTNSNYFSIDQTQLSKGIYFYQLIIDGKKESGKFIMP